MNCGQTTDGRRNMIALAHLGLKDELIITVKKGHFGFNQVEFFRVGLHLSMKQHILFYK